MRAIVLATVLLSSAAAFPRLRALAADAVEAAGPTVPDAPTPEALRLAVSVINRVMANHDAQVKAIAQPLADFVTQADKLPPERARIVVDEVVIPTMEAHWSSLRDSLVRSYALELSIEDLRALDAFYATPSGARFLAAAPRLTAAYVDDVNRWIRERAPEISARIKAVRSAHGWSTPAVPATIPAPPPPPSSTQPAR